MSKKQYNIRWRNRDHEELQRIVNNFNAKLYRLKKNHPELSEYLPDRVRKSELVKSIGTRADFNRTIKSLQRFSKKGAEAPIHSDRGAKTTKWEWDEYKRKERRVNARKQEKLDKIKDKPVSVGGKEQGKKRAEMGPIRENALKPTEKNVKSMSQKEWDRARRIIDSALDDTKQREKLLLMRENYLKGLTEGGFLDLAPEIKKYVMGISEEAFLETTQTDETATFLFYRDPISWEVRRDYIRESWETAYVNEKKKIYIDRLEKKQILRKYPKLKEIIENSSNEAFLRLAFEGERFNYKNVDIWLKL